MKNNHNNLKLLAKIFVAITLITLALSRVFNPEISLFMLMINVGFVLAVIVPDNNEYAEAKKKETKKGLKETPPHLSQNNNRININSFR